MPTTYSVAPPRQHYLGSTVFVRIGILGSAIAITGGVVAALGCLRVILVFDHWCVVRRVDENGMPVAASSSSESAMGSGRF